MEPKAVSVFQPVDRQAFVWFVALQVRAGDQLRVEWLDPSGAVSTTADYGELPTAGELCFTAQLPIAGFAPAVPARQLDGARSVEWHGGVFADLHHCGRHRQRRSGGNQRDMVRQGSGEQAQEIDFTVRGKNFQPGSLVLIAQYKPAGGWTYLASLQPRDTTANQLTVHYAGLPANEYLGDRGESGSAHEPADAVPDLRPAATSCRRRRACRGSLRRGRTARSRIGATACTPSILRRAREAAWWR